MKSLLLLLIAILPLAAAEPTLGDQLRDALYTEEVTRDPAKAAEAYAAILADFDQQRPLAASALFRLAEIRRAQGETDSAIALYQRLLRQFPEFEAETKLAREHLAALGGELPVSDSTAAPEQKELLRLQQLAKTAPDILRQRETLIETIKTGNIEAVRFLLDQGADPNGDRVLESGARPGFIDVVKLLLERGGKPSSQEAARAIETAILNKRIQMLAFLLEQGISPETSFDTETASWWFPLRKAAEIEDPEAIRVLIKHGADPDRMFELGGESGAGTLLHMAALNSNIAMTRLLLEAGADPNAASPDGGVSPLHLAATKTGDEALGVTQLLLEAGADPNVKISDRGKWGDMMFGTPLEIAVRARSEQVEAMIDAGGKVTLDLLRVALERSPANDHKAEAALFELLVEHTPQFDSKSAETSDLLEQAARRSFDIAPLIARGARPSKDWMKRGFQGADWYRSIPLLNEKFLFPEIGDPDRILLVNTAWHNTAQSISSLASNTNGSPPPPLSRVLLDADLKFHHFDGREMEVNWKLWRKNDVGAMSATDFDLAGDRPLPDLQWGDVIELRTIGQPIRLERGRGIAGQAVQGFREFNGSSRATHWNLRKRISFPIKLTVGDSTRDLTVRGDRLVYNPTLAEAPLLAAGPLIRLIEPPDHRYPATLTIRREGWQDVVLTNDGSGWPKFNLQPDDHLILDTPARSKDEETVSRLQTISLKVPGTPAPAFSEYDLRPEKKLAPTLVEFLVAAYAPLPPAYDELLQSRDPKRLGGIAASLTAGLNTPVILPDPDFSKLRILRIDAEGNESVLEVDLARTIEACTEATTPAEARGSDVALQAGDIIELPLLPGAETWTGFTEAQIRYFKKVLDGTIQKTDTNGEVSIVTIDWQPVQWTPTAGGLLPVPPESGSISTRTIDVLGTDSNMQLTRAGTDLGIIGSFHLRDGDRIDFTSRRVARPRTRQNVPQPRR